MMYYSLFSIETKRWIFSIIDFLIFFPLPQIDLYGTLGEEQKSKKKLYLVSSVYKISTIKILTKCTYRLCH